MALAQTKIKEGIASNHLIKTDQSWRWQKISRGAGTNLLYLNIRDQGRQIKENEGIVSSHYLIKTDQSWRWHKLRKTSRGAGIKKEDRSKKAFLSSHYVIKTISRGAGTN